MHYRQYEEFKIQVALHGGSVDGDDKKPGKQREKPKTASKKKDEDVIFGDPNDYKNLNAEEKEELNQALLKKFSKWAKSSKFGTKEQGDG